LHSSRSNNASWSSPRLSR